MLIFVGFFLWIWVAVYVFADIFRSKDMSGWAKALWVVAIFVLPLLGVLMYLIINGRKMQERAVDDAAQQEKQTREYIQSVAGNGTTSSAEEISKLAALRDSGALSDAEFESEKAKILGHTRSAV
jgi:hypothetical protein